MTQPPARRPDATGLVLLLGTTIGWGLNWPAMKVLLADLPVLSTRATSGALGFFVLAVVALWRRESLAVPTRLCNAGADQLLKLCSLFYCQFDMCMCAHAA